MMKSMNFLAALLKPAALTSVFVFLLLILCSKRLHFGSTSAKLMEIKVHWAWNLQLHFWLEALCHTQREWFSQCAVTDMKLLLLLFINLSMKFLMVILKQEHFWYFSRQSHCLLDLHCLYEGFSPQFILLCESGN